ncbi:MAG: hypothetical protein GEU75_16090 [Dehalococcoidia bacterium]|nr:hypothetical protein [Dehalococcoidia bacterium]
MIKLGIGIALAVAAVVTIVTGASAATISAKQSTFEEHQDGCLDEGGIISSWHFIINQITPASNAPASILVTWQNGDTQSVGLDRVTGKVGHYTVAATASHSEILSATAQIYDGWRGQFNLSSVECETPPPPPLDACAAHPNREVIVFNALLGDPDNGLSPQSPAVDVTIAAGTYAVTLQSFDAHSVHGGQGQMNEQWFARFTDGGTEDSGVISDLPDNLDELNEQVGNVIFTSAVTQVVARHELAGGAFPTPESITAVCVALDPAR